MYEYFKRNNKNRHKINQLQSSELFFTKVKVRKWWR